MSLAPSSPRLPSPPPPAEIQIGPASPSNLASDVEAQAIEKTVINANSKRRVHPGTKAADIAAGPPIVPLNEVRGGHLVIISHHATHHDLDLKIK